MTQPSEPRRGTDRPKLLVRVRQAIRLRNYSPRTEKAYVSWIKRFIYFHGKRHPAEMGGPEITQFLSHLATHARVGASTQNQALSALIFLYKGVMGENLDWLEGIVRAKRPIRRPVIPNRDEVLRILGRLHGVPWIMASLLYGAGLRVLECAQLRVKDLDFTRHEIVVRDGKGRKDRLTMLPVRLVPCLQSHLERVRLQHEKDLAEGAGNVWLPYALERKYPNAPWEWAWQWVFPATRFYVDRQSGRRRRHHLHQTVLQRAVKDGARRAGITKPVTCHTLRHAFATELLLRGGYDPRTVQELPGHRDLSTTMVYLHVLNKGGRGVQSPLDQED